MTQKERVLAALRRGAVCQVDFLAPNVIDGHPPITRLAARISDLREDGWDIREAGRRYGCSLYALTLRERAEPVEQPESLGHLFDPRQASRPVPHYEADAA